jgi:hypothetical protein
VKLKTINSQAPPLSRDTTAVLLGGWCAVPPATVVNGPVDPDHAYLVLYNIDGPAKLWRQHESWLLEQARLWAWEPTHLHNGRLMYYGEFLAAGGSER